MNLPQITGAACCGWTGRLRETAEFVIARQMKDRALQRGPLVLAREGESIPALTSPADWKLREAEVSFPVQAAFEVTLPDGTAFTAVDYASAGKDWQTPPLLLAAGERIIGIKSMCPGIRRSIIRLFLPFLYRAEMNCACRRVN